MTPIRTLASGVAASTAVSAAMSAARSADLTRIDFPGALGSLLREHDGERALGWSLFLGNGALLATGYRFILERTGGPTPLRGAALGLAHGAVAAAGAWLAAPIHPRPRAAGLPRSGRPRATELAVLCGVHVLYGALLGALLARPSKPFSAKRRRSRAAAGVGAPRAPGGYPSM